MQSSPVDDVGEKGVAIHLFPLLNDQVTHHEPVLLDSLGVAFLLAAY